MSINTNYAVPGYSNFGTLNGTTSSTSFTGGMDTSSLLSQPAYDTVSFSSAVEAQEEKKKSSTAKKVLTIGGIALAATTIWALARGKKVNGEGAKLMKNLSTGFKSLFTKAGRADYAKLVANSADDVAKVGVEAGRKMAAETQSQISSTSDDLAKLKKEFNKVKGDPAKNGKRIGELTEQIEQKETLLKSLKHQSSVQQGQLLSAELTGNSTYQGLTKKKDAVAKKLQEATQAESQVNKLKAQEAKLKKLIKGGDKTKTKELQKVQQQITEAQKVAANKNTIQTELKGLKNARKAFLDNAKSVREAQTAIDVAQANLDAFTAKMGATPTAHQVSTKANLENVLQQAKDKLNTCCTVNGTGTNWEAFIQQFKF